MTKFNHTQEVKDKITGFVGIIIGHADYMTGCDQYLVQPACKVKEKGTRPEAEWFDEARLVSTKKDPKISKKDVQGKKKGSDIPAPKK